MRFIRSVKYALNGIHNFCLRERNGQLQIIIAVIAVGFGFVLHISAMEWIVIILCIAAVLSLEMINSSIEKLSDMVKPGFDPQIKIIKDTAAGAVLIAAVASLIIGIIIFGNKIISLL
ncbi:MAG: diacylglycerol kinase [Bacteroidetes bacterium]|nr:MAG: diacylglycerol kinase [Bacteroidota bacterium]